MLTGMKGAGKTHFRQALFHEMGDERLKEKFNELERKRQKNDGIARTVITLNDRLKFRRGLLKNKRIVSFSSFLISEVGNT